MLFDRFVCPDCTADAQNLYDQLYLDQPDPELTECLQHIADLDADIDRKLAERSVVMANFEADHVAEVLAIGPRVDMRTDAEWWAAEHAGDGLTTVRGGPFATCVGSALDIERIEQQQDQWDQWDAEPDAKVAAVPRGGVMSADDG